MNIDKNKPFGFNIIGFISCDFGLGVAARNTLTTLSRLGYPVCAVDVKLPGRSGKANAFAHLCRSDAPDLPYATTIFHVNPGQIASVTAGYLHGDWKSRLNVCVPFWELGQIPDEWLEQLADMDVILAPSRFIEHAAANRISNCRVIYYPQTVFVNDGIQPDRTAFSLPDNQFLFVTSFDIASDLIRKNPVGVIDAFRLAFAERNDIAGLVIKINKSLQTKEFDALEEKLRGYVGADRRIRIMSNPMDYDTILSLYASCDAFVSLHRAEGLGLGPMESMSLSKPVIATYWSGNTDFMTPINSCPIKYSLVNCEPLFNSAIRPERLGFQGRWAEPDLGEAARWMRALVENRQLGRTIGERARLDMEQRRISCLKGMQFEMLKALFDCYREGLYEK